MICRTCHGTGRKSFADLPGAELVPSPLPCPECGGSGFTHCCEGDQVQPDREPEGGEAVE